jgi:hypothetical protein
MQPQLKYTRSEQHHHIWMMGDKDKQREPGEVTLHFPGGFISLARCSDNSYWIHASVVDREDVDSGNRAQLGTVIDSRIDLSNKSVNEANNGDLCNEQLEHFAVKIKLNHKD